MTATELYDLGYRSLVSVVPPQAPLAPGTTLRLEARGKVPGIRRLDGKWVGYDFVRSPQPSRTEVQKWEGWGANTGLLAHHFPGVDVDCDDPTLARVIREQALKVLGPAPVRGGRDPRCLLMYRTDEPFGKIAAKIHYKGADHVVEVLGEGRQYLVSGVHPTGVQYAFEGEVPKAEDLTHITAEQVLEFFLHLRTLLEGRATVEILGTGAPATEREAPPQDSLLAPSLKVLGQLVAEIPNSFPDRETYISVGYAIKAAAGGDAGLPIFQEWASRWEGGTNAPETVQNDWRRMHGPFTAGWGWLQDLAEQYGYLSAADEFEAEEGAVPPPEVAKAEIQTGVIEFTDTWVVEKLCAMIRDKVRFVPETGCWHIWNGHAWERDRRNLGEHLVRQGLTLLSAEIHKQAKAHPSEDVGKKLHKFAHGLQARGALTKAVPELQAHPRLTLTLDQFDADAWALNTPGGIVDLKTGKLEESDPLRLMSKATAVAPRKGKPELWLQFLDEATDGDEELQRFLQKQVGYSLTGVTQEQTLCFIHGPPLTGKSVFIEAIGGLFGSYHENAPAETFSATKSDRHPADLAKLAGARLVTSVETQEGRAWDTQRVKSLTGGDMISARFMRQDFFDFRPTFKIVIVGNHEPEIRGVDEAMMRRLRIVPFEHSPEEVDRLLGEKLKKEWPEILQWAIDGCLLWLREGLTPPEIIQARTAEYRRDENPVETFVQDMCVVDREQSITRQALYNAWALWCHRQGEEPGTMKQLKRRFRSAELAYGLVDARVDDQRGYRGIGLKEEQP